MLVDISFELENYKVELGKSVSGSFVWQGSNPKKLISVDISAGWSTRGKGNKDQETVVKQIFNEVKQDVIIPFSINIPINAPPTYEGKLIQIIWDVKMTVHIDGFFNRFGNKTDEYFAALKVFPCHYQIQSD